jgi:hypothetical protein
MLLVPDDGLAEVKARGLKGGRIVADIGVTAPDVKAAAGLQYTGDVAEPGQQQTVELLVADGREMVSDSFIPHSVCALGEPNPANLPFRHDVVCQQQPHC